MKTKTRTGTVTAEATTAELIDEFREILKEEAQRGGDPWVAHCQSQSSIGSQAYWAAIARDGNGKKNPHQYRIPNSTLQAVGEKLQEKQAAKALGQCTSFDEVYNIVHTIGDQTRGFGKLAIYDTALRIGFCRNLLPNKVYLHAGVRAGARQYRFEPQDGRWISLEELRCRPEFNKMVCGGERQTEAVCHQPRARCKGRVADRLSKESAPIAQPMQGG